MIGTSVMKKINLLRYHEEQLHDYFLNMLKMLMYYNSDQRLWPQNMNVQPQRVKLLFLKIELTILNDLVCS